MKGTLSTLGLGALLCLPCLAVGIGALGIAAGGAAVVALVQRPEIQAAGVLLVIAAIVLGRRHFLLRERSCSTCGVKLEQGASGGRVQHEHTP